MARILHGLTIVLAIVAGATSLGRSIPPSWFPSSNVPQRAEIATRVDRLDWKIRAAVGREHLIDLGAELVDKGIRAGRIEGIVGTSIGLLTLHVMVIVFVLETRAHRAESSPPTHLP